MQTISKVIALISILLLAACGDPIQEQIDKQIPSTQQRIDELASALSSGTVRNANLIVQYADRVKQLKPDLSPVINEFAKDASTKGPLYLSLVDRLSTAKTQPQMFSNKQALFDELLNIYQAADPTLFSDALSDPLNVLADMSDGALPRVNSLSHAQSLKANNAQDFGTGSQLIGNPGYGHWQSGSNGTSFWAWYGMYSMMGNVFGSRRAYYNDWGQHRNYSYYNDYGRTRYSSPSQLKQQNNLDTRTKKSFGNKGFKSAYSKNRTGASSLSRQSNTAQTSANRFRSTTNKSKFAKNASFRNSSSNTSRGSKRGK